MQAGFLFNDQELRRFQEFFASGKTRSLEFRRSELARLEELIVFNVDAICQALHKDLGKPVHESLISEIAVVLDEIRYTRKKLKAWMKPRCARTPLSLWPSRSRVIYEPLGVILIIGPWNYPFQLAMAPLVGAIAAGNCAVIKPSELTPAISKLMADLIEKSFAKDYVHVVEGGIPETTALLERKFDHIFFTGSTPVGKIVMQAAAKNLVPVTLELGGKSPAIVCQDADLDLAARRLAWGKFYNAGQTCVAPDYVYVHKSVQGEFLDKLKTCIKEQFGDDPKASQSFGRIVNERNCERLSRMMDARKIVHGGQVDIATKFIAPTVLRDVSWSDPVMQEEIFGPLLPVLEFEENEELFRFLATKPKPLSAYVFSASKSVAHLFTERLSFGGGCVNDVVVHLSNPYLPFGGVGESGMGHYHGENSFKTFSHAKSVMYRTGFLDISARYAPYTEKKTRFLRWLFGI